MTFVEVISTTLSNPLFFVARRVPIEHANQNVFAFENYPTLQFSLQRITNGYFSTVKPTRCQRIVATVPHSELRGNVAPKFLTEETNRSRVSRMNNFTIAHFQWMMLVTTH